MASCCRAVFGQTPEALLTRSEQTHSIGEAHFRPIADRDPPGGASGERQIRPIADRHPPLLAGRVEVPIYRDEGRGSGVESNSWINQHNEPGNSGEKRGQVIGLESLIEVTRNQSRNTAIDVVLIRPIAL